MGRVRGFAWLVGGLAVALLAGFIGFVSLARAQTEAAVQGDGPPMVRVVVAATDIPVRSRLAVDALELKEMNVDAVPEGAATRLEDVAGLVSLAELYAGEVVLTQRLVDPNITSNSGRISLALDNDKVLVAFPTEDLLSTIDFLKPGDQVDIFFSLEFSGEESMATGLPPEAGTVAPEGEDRQVTFQLLQNLSISAVVAGNGALSGTGTGENDDQMDDRESRFGSSRSNSSEAGARALLLVVSPQDALILKYMKDAGGRADLVLRAPGANTPLVTEPVDLDYLINRYRIPVR